MENLQKKIFSIIITFNGAGCVRACLDSVLSSSAPTDILVVDNASSDDTVAMIERDYPQATVIRSRVNKGYGQGCNIGIEHALRNGADYVALLNQDAVLDKDALATMLRAAEAHPDYGILIPINFTSDGSGIDPEFSSCLQHDKLRDYLSDLAANRVRDVYEADLLPGAVKLVSRDVLEKVGGFDPLFFLYGCEFDYLVRTRLKGWRVGLAPKAFVYHTYVMQREKGQAKRPFGQRVKRLQWTNQFSLKRMDRRFPHNLAVVFARYAIETLKAAGRRDIPDIGVALTAMAKTLPDIPRAYVSRRRSREKGVYLTKETTN